MWSAVKEPTPFLMLGMMSSHRKAALVGDVGEKRAGHVGRCGQQMGRLRREPLSWSLIENAGLGYGTSRLVHPVSSRPGDVSLDRAL